MTDWDDRIYASGPEAMARLAGAMEDAARMEWLSAFLHRGGAILTASVGEVGLYRGHRCITTSSTLRGAIDNAMAQEQTQKGEQ